MFTNQDNPYYQYNPYFEGRWLPENLSYSFEDTNQCLMTGQTTEGPYYLKNSPVRKDIRENQPGIDLLVGLKVVAVNGCTAIPGAAVDIWHCNAFGVYSGFENAAVRDGFEQAPYLEPTSSGTFLRGRQYTDSHGMVEFLTIYPGWYMLRTVHIHIKIFIGSKEVLTTQLFFPQELNYLIQSLPPYNVRTLSPYTNDNDLVLRQNPGIQGVWPKMSRIDRAYRATLTMGVAAD